MKDTIHIRGLDLPVHIGVPTTERENLQIVTADITLTLARGFDTMCDHIFDTVDYEAVANECLALAASRPRQLLETLASELVAHLLQKTDVWAVEIELRKHILPGTDHVAVSMRRVKGD